MSSWALPCSCVRHPENTFAGRFCCSLQIYNGAAGFVPVPSCLITPVDTGIPSAVSAPLINCRDCS